MLSSSDNEALLRTELMNQRTKGVHDHSVHHLKLGLILTSKPLYAETLSLFAPIYEHLEDVIERNKKDAQLGKLYPLLKDLQRGPRFRKDIAYYQGTHVIVSPSELDEYLQHLKDLEEKQPVALLAYIYHMYMAVFAGGYILKKAVTKTMRLTSEEGVQAYGHDTDPKVIREKLKDTINTMLLSPEQEEIVMEEGKQVFLRNDALVTTIRGGIAFREAETNLCLKISVAVIVAVIAVGVAAVVHSRAL
jgi:heme oxygenase